MPTFDADITAATPNPPNLAELLTPPPPPAGAPAAARRGPGWRRARRPAGAAGREARRGRLQDRRQLHVTRRRHGRPHPRRRERSERRARPGGDGGGQAGDSRQADPLRRQLASALRSRQRPRGGGGRRRDDPDASQQRAGARAAAVGPAHADRRQPVEGGEPPRPTSSRASAIATSGRAPTARSSSCTTSPTSTATACSWSICRPRSCCGRRTSRS